MDDRKILLEMGKRIAARRKEMKMTQEALAERVGVSLQTISCVELGKKAIRPYNLIKLCSVLETSTDYILVGRKSCQELSQIDNQLSRLTDAEYDLVEKLIKRFNETK